MEVARFKQYLTTALNVVLEGKWIGPPAARRAQDPSGDFPFERNRGPLAPVEIGATGLPAAAVATGSGDAHVVVVEPFLRPGLEPEALRVQLVPLLPPDLAEEVVRRASQVLARNDALWKTAEDLLRDISLLDRLVPLLRDLAQKRSPSQMAREILRQQANYREALAGLGPPPRRGPENKDKAAQRAQKMASLEDLGRAAAYTENPRQVDEERGNMLRALVQLVEAAGKPRPAEDLGAHDTKVERLGQLVSALVQGVSDGTATAESDPRGVLLGRFMEEWARPWRGSPLDSAVQLFQKPENRGIAGLVLDAIAVSSVKANSLQAAWVALGALVRFNEADVVPKGEELFCSPQMQQVGFLDLVQREGDAASLRGDAAARDLCLRLVALLGSASDISYTRSLIEAGVSVAFGDNVAKHVARLRVLNGAVGDVLMQDYLGLHFTERTRLIPGAPVPQKPTLEGLFRNLELATSAPLDKARVLEVPVISVQALFDEEGHPNARVLEKVGTSNGTLYLMAPDEQLREWTNFLSSHPGLSTFFELNNIKLCGQAHLAGGTFPFFVATLPAPCFGFHAVSTWDGSTPLPV